MSLSLALVAIFIVGVLALLALFSKPAAIIDTLNKEGVGPHILTLTIPLVVWVIIVKYKGISNSIYFDQPKVIFGTLIVTILFYLSGKK